MNAPRVCNGCGVEIVWGVTAKGSKVPLNPPEKRYIQGRSGKYIMVDTHTSHFATCPQADQFRKPSDQAGPERAAD